MRFDRYDIALDTRKILCIWLAFGSLRVALAAPNALSNLSEGAPFDSSLQNLAGMAFTFPLLPVRFNIIPSGNFEDLFPSSRV